MTDRDHVELVCQWPDCTQPATHQVLVDVPGQDRETSHVCRLHDGALKKRVVDARPRKPEAPPGPSPSIIVRCQCSRILDEDASLPPELRSPCPVCGSTDRAVEVTLHTTVPAVHDSLRARSKDPGKGGWIVDTQTGDSYTQRLEAWSQRELTFDRATDRYHELIELWDGTRIESSARLQDHRPP
jgi:hypothetical protein